MISFISAVKHNINKVLAKGTGQIKKEQTLLALLDPYWKEETNYHESRCFKFYRQKINKELLEEIKLKSDESRKGYGLYGISFHKCTFEMDIKDFVLYLSNMGSYLSYLSCNLKLGWIIFDGYFNDEEFDAPLFPFDNFIRFLAWSTNEQASRIILERTILSKEQFLTVLDTIEEKSDLRTWRSDQREEIVTLALCYDSGAFLPLDDEDVQRKMWYMSQYQPWEDIHRKKNDELFAVKLTKDDYSDEMYFRDMGHLNRFFENGYYKMGGPISKIRQSRFHFQIYASFFEFMGFLDANMNFPRTVHSFETFQTRINKFFHKECSGQDPIHRTSYTDGEGDDVQLAYIKKQTRLDDGSHPK